jgi:tetratricopeptide (TPR) repeat protein
MGNDRIAKALELYQKFPDNNLSRFNLAQAYFDAVDYANAAKGAYQNRPFRSRTLYGCAFPAQAKACGYSFVSGSNHLRPLCEKENDWMVVHILLGKCLLQAGQIAEAKRILEHALQLAVAQHRDGPREELQELLKNSVAAKHFRGGDTAPNKIRGYISSGGGPLGGACCSTWVTWKRRSSTSSSSQ